MHYVENMPGDVTVIAPLSSRVQKRILRRAVRGSNTTEFLTKHTDAVRAVIREVRDAYVFSVKHSILAYKLLSPAGRERFQGLRIAIPGTRVLRREFGMVSGCTLHLAVCVHEVEECEMRVVASI